MFKRVGVILALVATLALTLAPLSEAKGWRGGKDRPVSGVKCVKNGVRFLIKNDLLVAAAKQEIDYDTIDSDSGGNEGLINTNLPAESFLPLGTVILLHYTNPELFDWCLR
ncbi:MAG: hypothetical protein ACRDNI_04830 [Gaiellaceae bacterium]